MRRSLLVYLALISMFGLGIVALLKVGGGLESGKYAPLAASASPSSAPQTGSLLVGMGATLSANLHHPLSILFLQMICIIAAARLFGALAVRVGQPPVIGEIIAGIALGPSLLGALAPGAFELVFPAASLNTLSLLSQIGVVLFMFIVGMELDAHHLSKRAHSAVVVSHASIVVPFFLGVGAALPLYRELAPDHIPFRSFALFMGVALSITAFPVLARIIEERGLARTPLGNTAIACAAVDDVTAWSILAIVVALVTHDAAGGWLATIVFTLLFVLLMLAVGRPLFRTLFRGDHGRELSKGAFATVLVFTLASALCTEVIGIHALFGAFLAGVVVSTNEPLCAALRVRLESFAATFLLPLFFAFTGLRTQISLLNDAQSWLICGGIIAVAIVGKLVGSMLAARFTGMGWYDSFVLGALMNTRGLMELIALNIGYDLGILTPKVFAMMVLMALVTTFMAGPLIALADALAVRRRSLNASPAV